MAGLIEDIKRDRNMPSPALRRAIRVDAHVTQVQLAEELGVHPVTVARWEAGTREPRGDLRRRYIDLLDAIRQELSA